VALALSSFLFLPAEGDLLLAYREIFSYAFATPGGFLATVHRAIFLVFCTFAFLVPLRAGLWNIGLPGQVYAGALAAFAIPAALRVPDLPALPLPSGVILLLMVTAAAAAGAVLAGLAGMLRARLHVNEILVTMMLNSILFWIVAYMIREGGPFMGATAEGESFSLPPLLYAPLALGVPFTALLALGAAMLLDLLFAKSTLGYRIRTFGQNPSAARYAGINPVALPVLVFLLGGAFAGLAGYHYFAAIPGVYKIPGNYGYYGDLAFYGIICGLIARGSATAAIPVALLFAGLSLGARIVQGQLHLPFGVDYALLGLLMMTFVASHFLHQFRIAWRPVAPQAGPRTSAERPLG
jgi:simple sugar transport system permease protein